MKLEKIIPDIELFNGLEKNDIDKIVALCVLKELVTGDLLTKQGEVGDNFYIITDGAVEILISKDNESPQLVVHLGAGQLVGEMALVDYGPRAATTRTAHTPTIVYAINNREFHQLCEDNTHIGYIIMRNMAAELSFKLRHANISKR